MGAVLGALFVLGIVVLGTVIAGRDNRKHKQDVRISYKATRRCPTCGAQAQIHGDQWECGWCGDFGVCSRK